MATSAGKTVSRLSSAAVLRLSPVKVKTTKAREVMPRVTSNGLAADRSGHHHPQRQARHDRRAEGWPGDDHPAQAEEGGSTEIAATYRVTARCWPSLAGPVKLTVVKAKKAKHKK